VAQLQQLRRPLDVRERAASELEVELSVLPSRYPLPLDPGLHAPDLALVVGRQSRRPDGVVEDAQQRGRHVGVAGDGSGPGHRLALPDRRPPLEVGAVALDAARQQALLALGSQVDVDAPQPRRRRGALKEAAQIGGGAQPFGGVGGGGALEHEHEVEVAGVRQLGPAEAAERHHRERHLRGDGTKGGLHGRLGDGGDVVADDSHIVTFEHVASDDAEQIAVLPPQERRLLAALRLSPREGAHGGIDELGLGMGAKLLGVRQTGDEVDVALEDVGGEPAGTDEGRQPPGRLRRLAECPGEGLGSSAIAGQVAHAEQAEVGIRRVGEPRQHERQHLLHEARRAGQAARQILDGRSCAIAVGEAEGAQPFLDGARPGEHLAVGVGEGLEQRPEVEALVDRARHRLVPGEGLVELFERTRGAGVPVAQCPRHA
jgi:hypothetical protein